MRRVLAAGLLALCCVAATARPPDAGAAAGPGSAVLAVQRNPIVGQDPPAGSNEPGAAASASDGRSWWLYALLVAGIAAALLGAMALRRART